MITVNVRSVSYKVKGHGVDSAFKDHVDTLKKSQKLKVLVNSKEIVDILHIHTIDLGSFLFMKKYHRKNKKVVVSAHMVPESIENSLKLPNFVKRIFFRYMLNFYKEADKCVVVNSYYKNLLENLGVKNVIFIPNVVSKDYFKRLDIEKNEIRKKLNLPLDKFIVVGIGQIQKRKGIDDFLSTADLLKDIIFVWIGGFSFGKITDGYENYQKIVKNPPDNIIFTGIINRNLVALYLNASDVFFLPSYQELFPMAVLEAANCEIPIVLRDIPIYKEILYDKYLAGKNPYDFAKIIRDLKNKNDLYKEYKLKSKELSIIYSQEKILKDWEKLYESLVKE